MSPNKSSRGGIPTPPPTPLKQSRQTSIKQCLIKPIKRETECMCMCVCENERENVCVCERERERNGNPQADFRWKKSINLT